MKRRLNQKGHPMLTNEERDVVVAAMRKYPPGIDVERWGSSEDFLGVYGPKTCDEVKKLGDSVLLEHG